MNNADCHYGDHLWKGTSQCVRCGERLRCYCGAFVREDNLDDHVNHDCAWGKNKPRTVQDRP